jgi:uncharacterized membrane protein
MLLAAFLGLLASYGGGTGGTGTSGGGGGGYSAMYWVVVAVVAVVVIALIAWGVTRMRARRHPTSMTSSPAERSDRAA